MNQSTALHLASALPKDNQEIVQKLLRHPDIEVNPVNSSMSTPLMMASRNGNIKTLEVTLVPINTQ